MTAPDMENIIAGALAEHPDWGYEVAPERISCQGCDWEQVAGDDLDGQPPFAAHQAASVMAALVEAGAVEYGVQNLSGPDPMWKSTDKEAVDREVKRFPKHRTLVSRLTFPWERAE